LILVHLGDEETAQAADQLFAALDAEEDARSEVRLFDLGMVEKVRRWRDWCVRRILSEAGRAAMGSTLLRSPGSNSPAQ